MTRYESDIHHVAKLGPDVKATIGKQLRTAYDEVVAQGVPDSVAEILRRLDPASDGDAKDSFEKNNFEKNGR